MTITTAQHAAPEAAPSTRANFGAAGAARGGADGADDLQDGAADDLQDDGADGPAIGFAELGLPENLQRAVAELGFTQPTAIQASVLPALLAGRDVAGEAQTGTGKTAAFGLALLAQIQDQIEPGRGAGPMSLVLAPTRELALQLAGALRDYGRKTPGLRVAAVYGGAPYGPQKRELEAGAQIVVGTPGRLADHLKRGTFDLSNVRFLVLDEADEMLRMGFAEEVDAIVAQAPTDRQTALFSATMPSAIRAAADRYLRDPQWTSVAAGATAPDVTQRWALVPPRHKVEALVRTLATNRSAAIVFVRTRQDAQEVGQAVIARGISAAAISGEVAQREREQMIERLRRGSLSVLVATDVAARGIDVDRVGLVVNYDVPREAESYVHRIGRTGRAGRSGLAITFVTPGERGRLRAIERRVGAKLVEHVIPTLEQVADQQCADLLKRVPERLRAGQMEAAYNAVTEAVAEGGDPIALAAGLMALALDKTAAGGAAGARAGAEAAEFDRALAELRQRFEGQGGRGRSDRFEARRRHDGDHSAPRQTRRRSAADRPGAKRYWIAVGRGHGAQPGAIVGAITGETRLSGADLGRIEMFKHFSVVEIGPDLSRETMRRLGEARVVGRALRIRPDAGARR